MTSSLYKGLRVETGPATDPGPHPSLSRSNSAMTPPKSAFSSSPPSGISSSSQFPEIDVTCPHISVCRSLHIEVQIASPAVKVVQNEEYNTSRSLPVFNERDRVSGQIILDPSCHPSGRLSIAIEGAFQYTSPATEVQGDILSTDDTSKGKHIFFTSTTNIPVGASTSNSPLSAGGFFRDSHSRRRPSITGMKDFMSKVKESPPTRCFPFSFDLPSGRQPGQELPPTFSTSTLVASGTRGRAFVEKAEVNYKVTAIWEPSDGFENRALLEVPILLEHDKDFESLDGGSSQPEFWLEMPLTSDRSSPLQCAVTLPSPCNFPRGSTIPFYVVFTTVPKSSSLAREIASDATISVALVRQVAVSESPSLPPSPPLTPGSSSDDSDSFLPGRRRTLSRKKMFSRVAKSAPTVLLRTPRIAQVVASNVSIEDKPLPRVPSAELAAFSESRTLQTDVCVGFPKRPRSREDRDQQRALSPDQCGSSLPDGLYKGRLQLPTEKNMLPGFDWPGMSAKYYLEVSVIFRQEECKARIPIRIH